MTCRSRRFSRRAVIVCLLVFGGLFFGLWLVLLLRCGSVGLLLLFGSFLFGFHCFSSLSLILGIKIPPSWSGKIIKFGSDLRRTSQKTAVFTKFVFKSSAIDCTRV
nr:MAG TPA: hypothetical protein [Caudoviricetes sp.]